MNLSSIDLNLLVAFDMLMAERSVTRAAKRIGLTQSAMSNALRRLRDTVGDELFVRAGSEMVPTERALRLAEPIRNALGTLERVLSVPTFDPRVARRVFHIATADLVEVSVMPRLLRHLEREGPLIDLRVYSLPRGLPAKELETGRFDLAIGVFSELPAGFVEEPLYRERFTCILRRDHPIGRGRLTLRRFASLGHVLITPGGRPGGLVDRVLADHGLTRRVVVTTPHFLVAPVLVIQSDLVCTLAKRVARVFRDYLPIQLHKPPVEVPSFGINMVWHRRVDEDPAQRWLRDQVSAVCAPPTDDD